MNETLIARRFVCGLSEVSGKWKNHIKQPGSTSDLISEEYQVRCAKEFYSKDQENCSRLWRYLRYFRRILVFDD